jgi:hypothetical protein
MANHDEYLLAYTESTNRQCMDACNQWMDAKLNHPLYLQLSNTHNTMHDKELLNIIHHDIHALRQRFLELFNQHKMALQDYIEFV